MAQTFKCPACGAPLDYPADDTATVRCPYCDSTVIIPQTTKDEVQVEQPRTFRPSSAHLSGEQIEAITKIAQRLQSGRKIEAIKLYRQTFGGGLKEAKEAVEAMEKGEPVTLISHRVSRSGRVATKKAVSPRRRFPCGCLVLVLILIALIPVLYFYTPIRAYLRIPTDNPVAAAIDTLPIPKPYASVAFTFGSEGIGPGKFTDARHVAVDAQGNIYVAEWEDGSRVQQFDPAGNFVSLFTPSQSDGILTDLAVDRKGIVYLLQETEIYRYDGASGEFLGEIQYQEENSFESMATTVENGVVAFWAGDFQDEIVQFNSQGQVFQTIPNAISGQTDDAELDPHLAIDGLNHIYVLGTFTKAVYKFGPDGKFITRFGSSGDDPGQFRAPDDIAVDSKGRVYVSDFGEIEVFASDGRYLDSFSLASGPAFGLAFNDDDDLFVASRTQVYKYVLNE
jgi:streptogramin lyase/uncharacterized Zn finger protein (UPF0148 family)